MEAEATVVVVGTWEVAEVTSAEEAATSVAAAECIWVAEAWVGLALAAAARTWVAVLLTWVGPAASEVAGSVMDLVDPTFMAWVARESEPIPGSVAPVVRLWEITEVSAMPVACDRQTCLIWAEPTDSIAAARS